MTERGVVVKLKGTRAIVRFDRRSACDSCRMCAVSRDGMKVEAIVENTLGANVGDFVEVEMGERFVLTAAAIVYIIPLILVGAGVGIGVLFSETVQIILAVCGLAAGFFTAYMLDKFVIRKKKGYAPAMKGFACGGCANGCEPANSVSDAKGAEEKISNKNGGENISLTAETESSTAEDENKSESENITEKNRS